MNDADDNESSTSMSSGESPVKVPFIRRKRQVGARPPGWQHPASSTMREPGEDHDPDASWAAKSMELMSRNMEKSSMAWAISSVKIDKCLPEDGETSISRHTYARWKTMLLSTLQPLESITEMEKFNIFNRGAGAPLLDTLDGLYLAKGPIPSDTPFTDALERLDAYFNSEQGRLMAQMNFRVAKQLSSENSQTYLNRLVKLVKHCGFANDTQERELIMHVAANAQDRDVRRQAFKPGCTYETLRQYVQSQELLKSVDRRFERRPPAAQVQEVHAVAQNKAQVKQERVGRPRDQQRGEERFTKRRDTEQHDCARCGSRNHGQQNCPNATKNCRKCGLVGHFAIKCYTSQAKRNFQQTDKEGKSEEPPLKQQKIQPKTETELNQVGDSEEEN